MAPLKVNVCRSPRASMILTASAVDSSAIIAETCLLGKVTAPRPWRMYGQTTTRHLPGGQYPKGGLVCSSWTPRRNGPHHPQPAAVFDVTVIAIAGEVHYNGSDSSAQGVGGSGRGRPTSHQSPTSRPYGHAARVVSQTKAVLQRILSAPSDSELDKVCVNFLPGRRRLWAVAAGYPLVESVTALGQLTRPGEP
jgi:hypothetical protein